MGIGLTTVCVVIVHPHLVIYQVAEVIGTTRLQIQGDVPLSILTGLTQQVTVCIPVVEVTYECNLVSPDFVGDTKSNPHQAIVQLFFIQHHLSLSNALSMRPFNHPLMTSEGQQPDHQK